MKILQWFRDLFSNEPCEKTELGYICRHRTYANGKKECE